MREQVDRTAVVAPRPQPIRALRLWLILFAAGVGFSLGGPSWALTTYSSDTTISSTISDDVQVTDSANVTLAAGSEITGNLFAYNSSAVTLGGGTVDGSVNAHDSSAVTVQVGSSIGGGLTANGASTVDISGGTVKSASGDGVVVKSGSVTISGGSISSTASGGNGVTVQSGTVSISGGSISGGPQDAFGVDVFGGTVTVSGNAGITGPNAGVIVQGGTASIAGGWIHAPGAGVDAESGATVSISGGTISGNYRDVAAYTGTADFFGCNLVLANRRLTGTLADGTNINLFVDGPSAANLHNHLPQLTRPGDIIAPTDANLCTAALNPGTATVTGSDCGSVPTLSWTRSDGQTSLTAPYPWGITTITWTATDSFGQQSQAQQTVTVVDSQKPALTLPASQTVDATSDAGAPVSFTAAATDNCGTTILVCTDQNGQTVTSGATFPIGTTVVTCTATDGSGNQSAGSFSITIQPRADLAISLAASPMPVRNKQNLTYTLTVSNTGPTTATGVVISDPLPADTAFVSATASAGVTLTAPLAGTNVTLVGKLTSLAPNGSPATVTLTVAVNTKKTTISTTASVTAGTPDPLTGNNSATLAVAVK